MSKEETNVNNKSNQWELEGKCSQCRREKYCSKPCTRHSRRVKSTMYGLMAGKLNEMTGGVYGEIMSRFPRR